MGGAFVLTGKSIFTANQYQSRFFKEQFPDRKYKGEIYGIRFSESECGLYNYQTNILLAKYAAGFTPDPNYWDASERIITFGLDKTLLDYDLADYYIDVVDIK